MVRVLDERIESIASLCRKYRVANLHAFGSALRDDFGPDSDIDLLVEFLPMDGYARAQAYFDMAEELESLLGMRVDLVVAGAVKNHFIARNIERTKRMLYAA